MGRQICLNISSRTFFKQYNFKFRKEKYDKMWSLFLVVATFSLPFTEPAGLRKNDSLSDVPWTFMLMLKISYFSVDVQTLSKKLAKSSEMRERINRNSKAKIK